MTAKLFTLPALARELGVSYAVVYALRQRGHLQPHQCNGSREYYTLDEYECAARRSVQERKQSPLLFSQKKTTASHRIDYDALFQAR